MAKFKKLAILCTALVMCAGLATATACSEEQPSSSSTPTESSTPETPEEDGNEDDGNEDDGDEDDGDQKTSYTVTVNAPAGVTVGGTLTAEEGSDVIFTLTASQDMLLNVSGAVYVSEETSGDNVVYTYKVSAISRDRVVTVSQAYYKLVETKTATAVNMARITISAELPEGTYIIKSNDGNAKFGAVEKGELSTYLFEVTDGSAATDIVLYYFDFGRSSSENVEVEYSIYEILPIDLTGTTEGSLTLLAGAHIPVTFMAPAAGKYRIASTTDGIQFGSETNKDIYNSDWTEVIGSYVDYNYETKSSYVVTLEEGETINFFIQAASAGESFVFNYTAGEVVVPALSTEKATDMTLYYYEETELTFTATEAGTYLFTATDENLFLGVWSNEYGGYFDYNVSGYSNVMELELAQNETITIYAKYIKSGSAYADVSFSVKALTSALSVGTHDLAASADGTKYLFRAETESYYSISADSEVIGIADSEGNISWVNYYEAYLNVYDEVEFLVKGEDEVTVNIATVSYELNLVYGEELTVNIKGGTTYTVSYSGASYNEEVVITWDNANVVLVDGDGVAYNSGDVFFYSYYGSDYYLSTVDGSAATVTLLFNGKQYPALALGENTVSVEAETATQFQYEVVADKIGKYTFTVTGASINDVSLGTKGYSSAVKNPESLSASGSISITLLEGDMLYLTITSDAAESVTVNVEYTAPVINELVLGDNSVASLPVGEAVYFKTTLSGNYLANWSYENYMDYEVYVYAGVDEYGYANYSGESGLEFSNDGTEIYVIVTNTSDNNITNLVLNIAKAPTKVTFTDGVATYIEIPAGESVILQNPSNYGWYDVGTYTVSWDPTVTNLSVTYNNVAVANGDTVEFTSYYDPSQLIITTTDGTALATRIMVESYVAPATSLVVGDNVVTVTDYPGYVLQSFSGAAGTYTISCSEGGVINGWDGEWPDGNEITSFTLENDGDSFEFVVALDYGYYYTTDITVTITNGDDSGNSGSTLPSENPDLAVGTTTIYMIHEDGHSGLIYFTPEKDGNYVFSVEGAVVKQFKNLSWVALENNTLTCVAGTSYKLRVEPNDSATTSVDVKIEKESAASTPVALALGDSNTIEITSDGQWVEATFTAEEAGSYRIKLADENGYGIIRKDSSDSANLTLPTVFTLEANGSVTFYIGSSNETDSVVVVIEKYTGTSDDPATDDDDSNWTKNY